MDSIIILFLVQKMLLKAVICFCVLWSVAQARPKAQYSNDGQYDNGNQYDHGNQYDNNNGFAPSAGGHNQAYQDSRSAVITRYDYDNDGAGTYNYNITQSDGIYNEQYGTIENEGTEDESSRVYGYYAYPGQNGEFYYVEYVADKDGFRPAGKHIPQSASVGRVGQLGIPSAAIASLAGGGLG